MAEVTAIGVKKLRSLYDISDPIELRPITIFLGKNSAGKSTFARLFPLLRQSVERRKRSPILWFGDLVDYGSLSQAITKGSDELELILKLNFSNDIVFKRRNTPTNKMLGLFSRRDQNEIHLDDVTVTLTLKNNKENDSAYASKIQIQISDLLVVINIESDDLISSILINDKEYTRESEYILTSQGQILPSLLYFSVDPENKEEFITIKNPWRTSLIAEIKSQVHGNTSDEKIIEIANSLAVTSKENLVNIVKSIPGPQAWEIMKSNITATSSFITTLAPILLVANLDTILEKIDGAIANIFTNVRYLKPLRATAERYYRRLDLAVSEIDPEGRNFPMFLDSLTKTELASFRAWTKKYLSIDVTPGREGAQLTVMAKNANDPTPTNIADMGFGISQVLPIAAQLWSSSQSVSRNSASSFIVIEQPELHLHPEYQARLGDVFAGYIKNQSDKNQNSQSKTHIDSRLIIETHSQHLVNRLGALIEAKLISPDDVSVILFEPNQERPGTTKCRVSHFDSTSVLTNWPYGFFDPEF
jgi:predicted ATPase